MTSLAEHVLGLEARFMRRLGYVRAGMKVAPLLREEMAARGVTAKELALEIAGWAGRDPSNRKPLDWRTIKHAMEGSVELDTFLMLGGFFGWRFVEDVHTPAIGADPVTALENERNAMLSAASAINARLERLLAARAGVRDLATSPVVRGLPAGGGSRTQDHEGPRPAA